MSPTTRPHNLTIGDTISDITFSDIEYDVENNVLDDDRSFEIEILSATTFAINTEDSSDYGTWRSNSGGFVTNVPYSDNTIYYVENIGGDGGIKLVEDDDLFVDITPYYIGQTYKWDQGGFGSESWDSIYKNFTKPAMEEETFNKSYIVMERSSPDKNPWARSNHWYSIETLGAVATYKRN